MEPEGTHGDGRQSFSDEEVARRLEFLRFSAEDGSRIQEARRVLGDVAAQVADAFYEHLQRYSELGPLLQGRVEALKQTQAAYFEEMLEGRVDRSYVERRATVGRTHERIGLEPKWYMGAFNLYQNLTADALRNDSTYHAQPELLLDTLLSLSKLIFFDMSIAIDTYLDALIQTVRGQEAALRELSAPVIEVWDQILVLPIIGTVDTRRAQEITESLLEKVVEKQASVVILDITGLPVMDTSTANHLFKTVRAVELLGTVAIITGIRPAIAQTVVSLGVDTSTLRTRSRLVEGLKMAFEITGRTVREAGRSGEAMGGRESDGAVSGGDLSR